MYRVEMWIDVETEKSADFVADGIKEFLESRFSQEDWHYEYVIMETDEEF